MSAILLIPGRGGRYNSEIFTSTGIGADTIDHSRAGNILFWVFCSAGVAGTLAIEESLNGVTWGNSPTASAIAVLNNANYVIGTSGLGSTYSLLRINPANVTGLDSTHTFNVVFEGLQIGSPLF